MTRRVIIYLFTTIVLVAICSMGTNAQTTVNRDSVMSKLFGPGPVMSVSESYSSLPESIRNFLSTYFPNVHTETIELKTLRQIYNIKLTNGYRLRFNTDGDWLSIMAAPKKAIPATTIQSLVPENTYKLLVANKAIDNIQEMSYNSQKGYKIIMRKVQVYFFDTNGNPIQAPKRQWEKKIMDKSKIGIKKAF